MTPGARRVLQDLVDDDECDLVREGREVWCGDRQTTHVVLNELLRLTAISVTWGDGDRLTYFGINETGRSLLRRPVLEDELIIAIMGHMPFSIIDDRVVLI